ncbi:hypothetical protein CANCADRAFT_16551, partial [Tortispora caseinolytica NRRL Y-17796]
LRPYQEKCIDSILTAINNGTNRVGVSLATGAGKTVIFSHLIDRFTVDDPLRSQTLVLVHRKELVFQAATHCANAYPNKTIEIEMGKSHASGTADITIASIQSLSGRLEKYDPNSIKLVIVDEAHHAVAASYTSILEYLGIRHKSDSPMALVGFSATLSRHDGLKLGSVMDKIVYHRDFMTMVKEGWLAQLRILTVQLKRAAQLAELRTIGKNGDYNLQDLSAVVNTDSQVAAAVRIWLKYGAGTRKSTLVFCVDINHVIHMTEEFRKMGIDARYLTGNSNSVARQQIIEEFKEGKFPVLLNCGLFTEGTDLPNIDCLLMCRPTKSRNLLMQMLGRGLRLSPNKSDCLVIDFVAGIQTGIVSTPTLFGLDPDEVVNNLTANDLNSLAQRRKEEAEAVAAYQKEQKLKQITEVRDLILEQDLLISSGVVDSIGRTLAESRYAWVRAKPGEYILQDSLGSTTVDKSELGPMRWTLQHYVKIHVRGMTFRTDNRVIFDDIEDFEHALHASDTYAAREFTDPLLLKNAPWRKTPASAKQVDLLVK